jgi:hypothetical protein
MIKASIPTIIKQSLRYEMGVSCIWTLTNSHRLTKSKTQQSDKQSIVHEMSSIKSPLCYTHSFETRPGHRPGQVIRSRVRWVDPGQPKKKHQMLLFSSNAFYQHNTLIFGFVLIKCFLSTQYINIWFYSHQMLFINTIHYNPFKHQMLFSELWKLYNNSRIIVECTWHQLDSIGKRIMVISIKSYANNNILEFIMVINSDSPIID